MKYIFGFLIFILVIIPLSACNPIANINSNLETEGTDIAMISSDSQAEYEKIPTLYLDYSEAETSSRTFVNSGNFKWSVVDKDSGITNSAIGCGFLTL